MLLINRAALSDSFSVHTCFAYTFGWLCVCARACLLQFMSTSVFAWLIHTTEYAFVLIGRWTEINRYKDRLTYSDETF